MAHHVLFTLFLPPVAWLLYTLWCIGVNYRIARMVGVPLVVIPISPENVLWIILGKYLLPYIELLPFGNGTFTRFCRWGWQTSDNGKAHLELGDAFIAVTPGKNWLYLCNPEAVLDVFQRGLDFPRKVETVEMLNVFGPNVSTVEGQAWQRQRKITATSFSDQTMTLVWVESLRQATQMLQWWKSDHPEGVRSMAKNIKALTLHVLSSAGFGKSYPFRDSIVAADKSKYMDYRQALFLILENTMLILIFGPKFLARLSRPKKLAQIGQATVAFKRYMTEILEEEKLLILQGKSGKKNLMTSLIRASIEKMQTVPAREKTNDDSLIGHHRDGLTETEIYGNMFVFSFAGHDTTAHSLAFAITLLVANPEVQDWITEELQHYLRDESSSNWKYEDVFPHLKRCLAVLFETLRLYDPIIGVVKTTGSKPQALAVAGKTLNLPPDMHVNPNFMATHTQTRIWGSDSLQWRPSRWILSSPTPPPLKSIEGEHFYVPPKGSFVPWAEGPRSCPGKKFAQVEHVAVMAALFRNHRVQPVLKAGESMKQACLRIMDVVEDKGMILLLQMMNPENANVEWQTR